MSMWFRNANSKSVSNELQLLTKSQTCEQILKTCVLVLCDKQMILTMTRGHMLQAVWNCGSLELCYERFTYELNRGMVIYGDRIHTS